MRKGYTFATLILAGMVGTPSIATAQEAFMSEIRIMPYSFCPRGWVSLDGQSIAIEDNPALFALLGTTYGGDGRTTFSLPDLRGRTAVHEEASQFRQGVPQGATARVAPGGHTHRIEATDQVANEKSPLGHGLAASPPGRPRYVSTNISVNMHSGIITGGSNQRSGSLDNHQPSTGLQHCMATEGNFPSRN